MQVIIYSASRPILVPEKNTSERYSFFDESGTGPTTSELPSPALIAEGSCCPTRVVLGRVLHRPRY
jgi:hypothetical protein